MFGVGIVEEDYVIVIAEGRCIGDPSQGLCESPEERAVLIFTIDFPSGESTNNVVGNVL